MVMVYICDVESEGSWMQNGQVVINYKRKSGQLIQKWIIIGFNKNISDYVL